MTQGERDLLDLLKFELKFWKMEAMDALHTPRGVAKRCLRTRLPVLTSAILPGHIRAPSVC